MRSRYLVDKSALARGHLEPVRAALEPLFDHDGLATCAVIDLEVLYSARTSADYETTWDHRRANYVDLPITPEICARAVEVQSRLAVRGQHRGCGVPDLLIAACAELHGVPVLHYDREFDLIAEITGQPVCWVVPQGSVP